MTERRPLGGDPTAAARAGGAPLSIHGDSASSATAPPQAQTLYELELSPVPSSAWRAAPLRLPARLVTPRYTPELGRAQFWGKRIDRWVAYANSVVGGVTQAGAVWLRGKGD